MKKTYLQPSLKVKTVRVAQILQTSVTLSSTPATSDNGVDAKDAFDFDLGDEDVEVSEAPEAEY